MARFDLRLRRIENLCRRFESEAPCARDTKASVFQGSWAAGVFVRGGWGGEEDVKRFRVSHAKPDTSFTCYYTRFVRCRAGNRAYKQLLHTEIHANRPEHRQVARRCRQEVYIDTWTTYRYILIKALYWDIQSRLSPGFPVPHRRADPLRYRHKHIHAAGYSRIATRTQAYLHI